MPWPCQQIKLPSTPLESILSFSSIALIVLSSQMRSDVLMSYSWLWIDAKTWFYCDETSLNIRLKDLHGAIFIPLWANVATVLHTAFSCQNLRSICNVQHFLKCLTCMLVHALSVDGDPIPFWGFLHNFWRGHLIWLTIAMFAFACRIDSYKLCHQIFYYCKRWRKLLLLPKVESISTFISVKLRPIQWK